MKPLAYLHTVTQDDGDPDDQALSFSPDSFPFKDVGGFRSLKHIPLFGEPLFTYSIGQQVIVLAVQQNGTVTQRCDRGANQVEYQVVFWHDGKRQAEWLMPHELKATP